MSSKRKKFSEWKRNSYKTRESRVERTVWKLPTVLLLWRLASFRDNHSSARKELSIWKITFRQFCFQVTYCKKWTYILAYKYIYTYLHIYMHIYMHIYIYAYMLVYALYDRCIYMHIIIRTYILECIQHLLCLKKAVSLSSKTAIIFQ